MSVGERVDLESLLVPGKFVILDFYADWCGPCLLLEHELERLLLHRQDVALRTVDIVDWGSEAAAQLQELSDEGIPYVRVYDPQGTFIGAVHGNDSREVRRLIESTR